jgi:hypothetical protein
VLVSAAIVLGGIYTFTNAPEDNLKQHVEGLFWGLFGMINIAVMKLWANTTLTMYFIIWDRKNRIEGEINKLESVDL